METLINAVEANEKMAANETQDQPQVPVEESNNINENDETRTAATTNSDEIKENTDVKETPLEKNNVKAPPVMSEEDAKWHTVGIYNGLSATVNNYIDNNVWSSACTDFNSESLPDLSSFPNISLEPGTAYRFRIRAINACGPGEWSEVSSFKTCLPGFPGAPSAIKISKSAEGAHLTWEPPPSCTSSNEIIEYSVYLAVKPGRDKEGKTPGTQRTPAQLAFIRVYVGSANQCTVSQSALTAAHVDCSNKPAIIFRIAARNEKGYGPATQVRWLQDTSMQNAASNNTNNSANSTNQNNSFSPQRGAKVEQGASPIKRFKTNPGRNLFAPEM